MRAFVYNFSGCQQFLPEGGPDWTRLDSHLVCSVFWSRKVLKSILNEINYERRINS